MKTLILDDDLIAEIEDELENVGKTNTAGRSVEEVRGEK